MARSTFIAKFTKKLSKKMNNKSLLLFCILFSLSLFYILNLKIMTRKIFSRYSKKFVIIIIIIMIMYFSNPNQDQLKILEFNILVIQF